MKVTLVLLAGGVAFGAATFGIPTAYGWWLKLQCAWSGPESQACWWLDLLERPIRR